MKKIVALLVGTLLLVGCSSITSGTITAKDHKDAYSYTTPQCSMFRTNGTCAIYIYVNHDVPEKWYFGLDDGEDTGWVSVTEDTYNGFEIGDHFEGRE